MKQFIQLLEDTLNQGTFIRCIFSNPRNKGGYQKITLKPVLIKENLEYQFAKSKDHKEYHTNVPLEKVMPIILSDCQGFKQIQLYTTTNDYQCLISKKGEAHIKKQPPTLKAPTTLSHNRQKKYLLDNPLSEGFLKALGLMDDKGQIKPTKYDKYKQINRYLEFVADCMDYLPSDFIRIIDFGCGKSYLTFALYHYLTEILNKKVEVVGLDLKSDVIAFCNDLANKLHYTHLHFQVGVLVLIQRINLLIWWFLYMPAIQLPMQH